MCLITLAHGFSERFPLVIAANRDEDHERATRDAHFWEDAPDVLGGRDVLHGGSWLAVTRAGRFAAVTNLRGAVQRKRSRGFLVRNFVTSDEAPEEFAATVSRDAAEYSGFHLLAGEARGSIAYVGGEAAHVILQRGIHGFSNARAGEHWPKVDYALARIKELLESARDVESLTNELLRDLRTTRNIGRVEEEVFIVGDRYGTRSSTVVIATGDELFFAEQSYARGGVAVGEPRRFHFTRLRRVTRSV